MRALTLWRPWSDAIATMPEPHAKRIENRSRRPPAALVGEDIAIHAGRRYDREAAADIATHVHAYGIDWTVPGPKESPQGVVCVARLVGVVDVNDEGDPFVVCGVGGAHVDVDVVWWTEEGPGWVFDRVRPIEAVPCRGALGLWTVPPDVEALVRARVEEARR